jgi:hypothetical protein
MTAAEWWTRARDRASGQPARWRDVDAFRDLSHEDRRRIGRRIKAGLRQPDGDVRRVAWRIAEEVEVAGWQNTGAPMLEHLAAEITAAAWAGRTLDPDAPVPGCTCERCTGRTLALRARTQRPPRAPLDLDAARALDIRSVARMLGLEVEPKGWARCPFHDDNTPSLHLNAKKQRAFCNPCSASWDGIALTMELRRCTLPEAVRWLTGVPEPERRSA